MIQKNLVRAFILSFVCLLFFSTAFAGYTSFSYAKSGNSKYYSYENYNKNGGVSIAYGKNVYPYSGYYYPAAYYYPTTYYYPSNYYYKPYYYNNYYYPPVYGSRTQPGYYYGKTYPSIVG